MEEKKLKVELAAKLITESTHLVDIKQGEVLDLACGSGRNGLWFADKGYNVTFVDKSLTGLAQKAPQHTYREWNLEDGSAPDLPKERYDVVLVFNYLHRPLWEQITACIKPGGLLIYETFTEKQAEIGRPRNPKFLLKADELKNQFVNWTQVHYFEGVVMADPSTSASNPDNLSYKAQLIAKKP